jgi:BirA family biotin operon repressor/biotin-[acetyl-CoA-carboxylase] ligase
MTPPAATWRLKIFETIDSTSDLCRSLAAAGEPEGLAVLARRQDKGRGRGGHVWLSAPGNLYLSVLLRPRGPIREGGLWSLLAAVALAETVAALLPDASALTLKWPNDLLLHGRKLAGILLDSAGDTSGGLEWLVIGFGLNLAATPEVPGRAIASVAEFAQPPPPEQVAEALLASLDHWRHVRLAQGFAPVRTAWLARAQPIGAHLTVKQSGEEVGGSFAGLADDGSLLLQTGGRLRAFVAGEIVPQDRR